MSSSTNTTITPLEEATLQDLGQGALTNLGSMIVLALFYGSFIPLFSMSVYMSIRRGVHRYSTWVVLLGTAINFAIMTVQWIMGFTWLILTFQTFLVHNGNLSLEDRISLEIQAQGPFANPLNDMAVAPLLVSDAFVVWRASLLFPRKWAMVAPILCLFCTFGAFIGSVAISVNAFVANEAVTWAILGLSLATNFISTGMIGWRLWIYRKHVLPSLDGIKSPVHSVIVTLIETGAALCFIQFIILIIQIALGAASAQSMPLFTFITTQVLYDLPTLYPTFIVVICRNQSSRVDEVASISMNIGNELRFATMQASQSQPVAVSAADLESRPSHLSLREPKANTRGIEIEMR